MKKSVVRLIPHTVAPIWSGNRLSKEYKRFCGKCDIGEAWETSVENGAEASVCDEDAVISFADYLTLNNISSFPLIKLIDAMYPLSVQVHPDEDAAKKHGGASKNEIWYVLLADEDSFIYYGTKDGVTTDDISDALSGEGDLLDLLNKVTVCCGDVFMIPPGMIHSLGAGITVLEVQNTVGTTYRLKDIAGNREIHTTEALDSLKLYSRDEASVLALTVPVRRHKGVISGDIIASTDDYRIVKYVSKNDPVSFETDSDYEYVYLFCESGGGSIDDKSFEKGDALFIIGNGVDIYLDPCSTVIVVS